MRGRWSAERCSLLGETNVDLQWKKLRIFPLSRRSCKWYPGSSWPRWLQWAGVLYYLSQSVQSLSCVRLFATPWTAARQASLSITNSQSLLKLMSIELVMPSSHLLLCHPLLSPSIFPSIRFFFKWVSSLHQEAKVLEFQLQYQSFQWTFRT